MIFKIPRLKETDSILGKDFCSLIYHMVNMSNILSRCEFKYLTIFLNKEKSNI